MRSERPAARRRGEGRAGRGGRRLGLVAALVAITSSSCSFVLDGAPTQCEESSDCRARGAEFAKTVCGVDKTCVTPPECTTNAECIAKNGGKPAICRATDQVCASVLSPDCDRLVGAVDKTGAILLGFLGDQPSDPAATGSTLERSVELAFTEVTQFAAGLPGGTGGPRSIAFLVCDESKEPARAARHLVDDLGVPAIIGPSSNEDLLLIAQQISIPKGVLLLSPSATIPAITDLADDGLVWRTAPSDANQAVPLNQLVLDLEQSIRDELMLSLTTQIRVAVTVKGDAYGTGLADVVRAKVSFNGEKSVVANGNNFMQKSYPDDPAYDFSDIVASLVQYKPNIVILVGTQEIAKGILGPLEAAWPTDVSAPPRPRYILPTLRRPEEALALIGPADDDLRKRIIGTVPGRKTTNQDLFASRYQGAFKAPPDAFGASNAYDAAYLSIYSIVAAGQEPLTGARMTAGLAKLVQGSPVDVGPNPVNTTFAALAKGGSIDLDGASGSLDFDLTTGDAPNDVDVWCIGRAGDSTPIFVESGEYYDAKKGEVVGELSCP